MSLTPIYDELQETQPLPEPEDGTATNADWINQTVSQLAQLADPDPRTEPPDTS